MIRAVILTGASGTGKSTLAADLSAALGWELAPSQTAAALKASGINPGEPNPDPAKLEAYQIEVTRRTAAELSDRIARGVPFISERGADVNAYTAIHGCRGVRAEEAAGDAADELEYIQEQRYVLVVFCRPVALFWQAARDADDGRRAKFLSDHWVYRVDGAIAYSLNCDSVNYLELSGPEDRQARTIKVLAEMNARKD